jgi:hypothetical protein
MGKQQPRTLKDLKVTSPIAEEDASFDNEGHEGEYRSGSKIDYTGITS